MTALRGSLDWGDGEPECCAMRWPDEDAPLPGLEEALRSEAGVRMTMHALTEVLEVDGRSMRQLINGFGVITLSKAVDPPGFQSDRHVPDRYSPIIARGLIDLLLRFPADRTDLWLQKTNKQTTWAIAIDVAELLWRYVDIPLAEYGDRLPKLFRRIDEAAPAWRRGDGGVLILSRLMIDLGVVLTSRGTNVLELGPAAGRVLAYIYANSQPIVRPRRSTARSA